MCGRFTRNYTWAQLQALYKLSVPTAVPNFQPRFNVCPTDPVDTIVPEGDTRTLSESWPAPAPPAHLLPAVKADVMAHRR
jgi:putative SOS response-associated peptidase YedK